LISQLKVLNGFTPERMILPVSAAMLRDGDAYDASVEAVPRPLRRLVQYLLDDDGRTTVQNETPQR